MRLSALDRELNMDDKTDEVIVADKEAPVPEREMARER